MVFTSIKQLRQQVYDSWQRVSVWHGLGIEALEVTCSAKLS